MYIYMEKRFVLSKKVIVKNDNQPQTLGADDEEEKRTMMTLN